MPKLKLKSHNHLLRNWWSESPFDLGVDRSFKVPLFSFKEGSYIGQQIGRFVLT